MRLLNKRSKAAAQQSLPRVGSPAPDFELQLSTVALAAGIGHRPQPGMLIKLQAQAPDVADFSYWTFMLTLVNRWEDPRKSIIPR